METRVPELAHGVINGSEAAKWELGYDTSSRIWVSVPKGVDLHVLTLGMLKFLIRICSSLDLASGYFDSLLLHFFRPWLISKNKNKENTICPMRCLSETGSSLYGEATQDWPRNYSLYGVSVVQDEITRVLRSHVILKWSCTPLVSGLK